MRPAVTRTRWLNSHERPRFRKCASAPLFLPSSHRLLARAATRARAAVVTVHCGSIQSLSIASGAATNSCLSFTAATGPASAGLALDGVTLDDFTECGLGTGASNDSAVTFTTAAPGGVTWATPSRTININGGLKAVATSPPMPVVNAVIDGLSFAYFTTNFDVGMSSVPIAGAAVASSALARIAHDDITAMSEPPASRTRRPGCRA